MNRLWVTYDGDEKEWYVRYQGHSHLMTELCSRPTKIKAVKAAQTIGRVMEVELFIRAKDGRITDRRSYGNDPKGRG